MDRQPQTPQSPPGRDSPAERGPGPDSRPEPKTPSGPALNAGPILVRTLRHFFPDFNSWLDDFPDPRCQQRITYDKRFLLYEALGLFLFKLGARRQLDFEVRDGPAMLANLNRLADTHQEGLPVNKTVNDYLAGVSVSAPQALRRRAVGRLIRNKVFEPERLQRRYLVLIDGSDHLSYDYPHCEHCLRQSNGKTTTYRHPTLEAKLLGPGGLVASIATVFLSNQDGQETPANAGEDKRKQDCELKAFVRLAELLKQEYPQLVICIVGDNLFACGRVLQVCKEKGWDYLLVFKEGRMPALWTEFQTLLGLCPEQKVQQQLPDGTRRVYRWVNDLDFTDGEGRKWRFNAVQGVETSPQGQQSVWAWITNREVNRATVAEVGEAGRSRWCIENQGFNVQKNSDLNLEHAYSKKEGLAQVYYLLLQMAHLILQLVEKGSLLQRLAQESGKSVRGLFGSLKNIARRILESFRMIVFAPEVFDRDQAKGIQIRLNSS